MRVALKVTLSVLLYCPTMTEKDVGVMTVEVEPSHQYPVIFCCHVTDSSRGAVWQNSVWNGSVYEAKVCVSSHSVGCEWGVNLFLSPESLLPCLGRGCYCDRILEEYHISIYWEISWQQLVLYLEVKLANLPITINKCYRLLGNVDYKE